MFGGTYVLLWEPLVLVFQTSGDVSSRFQIQSGQPYLPLAEAHILHVP